MMIYSRFLSLYFIDRLLTFFSLRLTKIELTTHANFKLNVYRMKSGPSNRHAPDYPVHDDTFFAM